MNQRGAALVSTLGIAMILLPLGVFVAMQCRIDLMIQRNLRAEMQAFYVAEAGLEHALAEIPAGSSFDAILAGPDRTLGTGDDGAFPFTEGPVADFPDAPFRYEVRVTKVGSALIRLVSQGQGVHGASKVLVALVTRSPIPFTPAALVAEGDITALMGSARFSLSGLDHRIGDPASQPTGSAAAIPAVAGPSAAGSSLDLHACATAVARRSEGVTLSAPLADDATIGLRSAPQISVVPGDLEVSGSLSGCGILVVRGTLHVTGRLAFTGLVLAMGGVVFEPSSTVTVTGALWHAADTDERLDLRGSGFIVYSSQALAENDPAFPGLLPHAAVLTGWQEQL